MLKVSTKNKFAKIMFYRNSASYLAGVRTILKRYFYYQEEYLKLSLSLIRAGKIILAGTAVFLFNRVKTLTAS